MATILKFDAAERVQNPSEPRRLRLQKSAEIVIFPGVRYEYWPEPEAPARAAVERDRLDPGE